MRVSQERTWEGRLFQIVGAAELFPIITPAFRGRFLYFCTTGNGNEYSVIYLFNGLMTSYLHHHIAVNSRHRSLLHRVTP